MSEQFGTTEHAQTAGVKRLNFMLGAGLLLIMALTASVFLVGATEVTSRSDTLSNQSASALSSHTVRFTLSGGNTLAAGESIVVDFREDDGAFAVSGSTFAIADVSINDGIARTTYSVTNGAASCAGSVGANDIAVGIADATGIMTFTPCASFSASAAGATVTIRLGAAAGGTNRITNPTAGSYVIDVVDAAGDCAAASDDCTLAVGIVDSPNVTITASVGEVCGNGIVGGSEQCDDSNTNNGDGCSSTCQNEGGSGVPSDSTPPVISNVQVLSVGTSTATISWSTNESADSVIEYGPTVSYGSTYSDPLLVTSHLVNLGSLTSGVTYHFRVCSEDNANNTACSGDLTFTTLDTTPPVISNVQVTGITHNAATVTWTTNENASSYVDFDTDGAPYGSTQGDAAFVASHSVTLTGLTASTVYHFRVRSGDAASNESFTTDATFTTTSTPDTTAPVITNVQVSGITATGATVTWTTDEAATSYVDYDTDGSPYASTAGSATPVLTHSVALTGLTGQTTYHFRVRSADSSANETFTSDATFSTSDATPPIITDVQITGLTATGATIVWTTNEIADSKVDYGRVTQPPYETTVTNGTLTTSHSMSLAALTPNTAYQFRVRSADAGSNEAQASGVNFTTPKPAAPVISIIQVTNITESSARVTWTTSTDSDSVVEYGLTTAYGDQVSSPSLVTAHLGNLQNLAQNTTYHFRVTSTDAYAQTTTSADGTFTTTADTTAPANVTGLTATPGDAQVSLSWTNPTTTDFAGVRVMRKTAGFPTGPTDGVLVYSGTAASVSDTGVSNDVLYYYAVYAFDEVPNYATGAVVSATPTGEPDTTPPGAVSGFTATPGDGQIELSWNNPTDPDFTGTRIVRKAGGCPADRTDGTVVHDGANNARLDLGLTNGTTYCYAAFTYDIIPNFSGAVTVSATPQAEIDLEAPGMVTNFVAVAGDAEVLLTWVNPTDIDWQGTRIVRKSSGVPTGPTDGIVIFDAASSFHLDDVNLVNGTTYYYAAFAYDSASNFAAGASASATPQEGLPPLVLACADSDGGRTFDVAGTVTTDSGDFMDTCVDSTMVREYFCAADLVQEELYICGAGLQCIGGRCVPEDYVPMPNSCGNSFCDGIETSITCPVDCPASIGVPFQNLGETNVPPEERLELGEIKFFATETKIELVVGAENNIEIYPAMTVRVYVPDSAIKKPIREAYITIQGTSYIMRETHSFESTVVVPKIEGDHPFIFSVLYQDGTHEITDYRFDVQPFNMIYEIVDGKQVPVKGARVAVFQDLGGGKYKLWDAVKFGQLNPITTNESGAYGFIAEPGTYRIQVEAPGFRPFNTLPFRIRQNLVGRDVEMVRLPPPLIEDPIENVVQQTAFIADAIRQDVIEVVQNEFVEEGAAASAPVVAAVAVANVATAGAATATAIPYAMYLYSLLAHPTLLIARRRRKKWGIVFNAITGMPVDLAIVRLLDADTGRILRSAVTDKEGRYFFIVKPGTYRIAVTKAGFSYPTEYLKDEKQTVHHVDIYHGETISAQEETTITASIPVDPLTKEKKPARVVWEGIARRAQGAIGLVAIAAMLVAVIITPTPTLIVMLVVNVTMYAVFRRLAVGRRPKNWGIVYDKDTGKPLRNVVARIFESKYNKLLETQVTDGSGRYAFLVGSNVYYVTYEKPGYQMTQKGPVDLVAVTEEKEQFVAEDVTLGRENAGAKGESGEGSGGQKPVKPSLLVGPKGEAPNAPAPTPAVPEPPKEATVPWEKREEVVKAETKNVPWELRMVQGQREKAGTEGEGGEGGGEQQASAVPAQEKPSAIADAGPAESAAVATETVPSVPPVEEVEEATPDMEDEMVSRKSIDEETDEELMSHETAEEELAESAVGSVAQALEHTHLKTDKPRLDEATEANGIDERIAGLGGTYLGTKRAREPEKPAEAPRTTTPAAKAWAERTKPEASRPPVEPAPSATPPPEIPRRDGPEIATPQPRNLATSPPPAQEAPHDSHQEIIDAIRDIMEEHNGNGGGKAPKPPTEDAGSGTNDGSLKDGNDKQ